MEHLQTLRERRVRQAKPNCVKKTDTEKESLTRSKRTNDQEPRCDTGDSIFEVANSVNDVTSVLEKKQYGV